MNTENTQLVLRDYPIVGWFFGILFLIIAGSGLGIHFIAAGTTALVIRGILGLVGLVILLITSALTVTADRSQQTLTLHYRSLLKESTREILFSQIEGVQMDIHQERGHSDSNSGPSYRIVIVLKDGGVVPLRQYYTGGSGDKTRKIKQLREFIGIGGSDMGMGLLGTLREGSKRAQQVFQVQQESLTGRQDAMHVTDGVSWQVQTIAFGGSPVTRWFSPDCQTRDGFVYISQIVEGQKMAGGGLLGNFSGMLFRQSMAIYGFGKDDTPGFEGANLVTFSDARLAAFSVFTSDPTVAQRLLNPQTVTALADWARRYPLKQGQSQGVFSQLVVLFSPKGVFVASLGTMIPEAVEDMSRLGVVLIKGNQ